MRIRRDILLFVAVAIAAVAGGWWLLSHRPGAAVDDYLRAASARPAMQAAAPVAAETFRATACSGRRCVLIEAGGLAFLFGAGEGAGDSLRELGLMRTDMDVVLLPELDLAAVAGLPGVARAAKAAGRVKPLSVNGPSGIVAVVDGANLMASADDAVRLSVGADGLDEGLAGRIVFDSGVVAIRMFATSDAKSRAYRVDFDGKSLVLAGCRAGPETILAAARGTTTVAGILTVGSDVLAPQDRTCTDVGAALTAASQGRLAATLVTPGLAENASDAWLELISRSPDGEARLARPGARLDLTGDIPQVGER